MTRLRTYLTAALVGGALLSTTAAGCGSGGRTIVVGGTGSATCAQHPYNYAFASIDPSGSGISVIHGIIRGSMWVSCDGSAPASFTITVKILRDGIDLGHGSTFTGIPNIVGYEAWTIADCTPGVYRLQYKYRWTYNGGVQSDLNTVTKNQEVTQHDCDTP